MKLALTLQTPEVPKILPVALLQGALPEKLAKARRFGADGVELATIEPASLERAWLHQLLQEHNLSVAAIASGGMAFAARLTLLDPHPKIASLAYQRLLELIDLAHDLNAPVVTLGSFRGRSTGEPKRAREDLARILHKAGEYAAQNAVHIALEPLNRYENDLINNAQQGLEFLRQVESSAVGLLLDTFHMNIEESSWKEPILLVAEAGRLLHVHFGDNNRLPPGQGMIDFRQILNLLRQVGYNGWLSAELLALPDPDRAAEQSISAMRNLLAEIQ
jgi:sugar phosphate isomerase/epimerase